MNQPDEDALWRSIVDNYGERATLEPGSDPAAGRDTPGTGPRDADDSAARPRGDDVPPAPPVPRGSGDAPAPDPDRIVEPIDPHDRLDAWDDPEDHYVPPDPPPLPRLEPPQLLAWAGVVGVPLLTILLAVLHVTVPSWGSLLGLVWFVGGFGYLVATMRRDRDDDEWDDGAVL